MVGDNVEIGIYPIAKAKSLARELELDLVEISPKAVPPVCKIIDYKKFLYEQKKREKAQKAKASKVVVKEIRFGPNTDEHDVSKIMISIDKAALMIQSATLYGTDGNLYVIHIKKLVTNKDLADSEFIFDASKYDDVEEIDLR